MKSTQENFNTFTKLYFKQVISKDTRELKSNSRKVRYRRRHLPIVIKFFPNVRRDVDVT